VPPALQCVLLAAPFLEQVPEVDESLGQQRVLANRFAVKTDGRVLVALLMGMEGQVVGQFRIGFTDAQKPVANAGGIFPLTGFAEQRGEPVQRFSRRRLQIEDAFESGPRFVPARQPGAGNAKIQQCFRPPPAARRSLPERLGGFFVVGLLETEEAETEPAVLLAIAGAD